MWDIAQTGLASACSCLYFCPEQWLERLAMNLGAHKMLHPRPFWDNTSKTEYMKTVASQLDLTPTQRVQMESILDDFSKYYQTVLSDGKARIFSIFNR